MKNKNPKESVFKKKGFYTALYSCTGVAMVIAAVISYNNLSGGPGPEEPKAEAGAAALPSEDGGDVETFIKLPGSKPKATPTPAATLAPTAAPALPTPTVRPAMPTPAPARPPAAQPPAAQTPAPGGTAEAEGEIDTALEWENEAGTVEEPDSELFIKTEESGTAQSDAEPAEAAEAAALPDPNSQPADPPADAAVFNAFDGQAKMAWPVLGPIVMEYSDTHAIYDQTLDQYRTNDTLCIQAEIGTQVRAAADGVVERITQSRESGNTVTIDNGNGWKTTYTQLQDGILVREGEVVKQGQVIGGVGYPSIYSVLLGSHVGFKVTSNEAAVDPNYVLAE
jgi:murein DD-endopeptidase MepM/ murein hydrolase activator NlpD